MSNSNRFVGDMATIADMHDSLRQPFLSLHTLDGRYRGFQEQAFAAEGIDTSTLLGASWYEFCPADAIQKEDVCIRRTIFTEKTVVLGDVVRYWPQRSIRCRSKITLVYSRGGLKMLMREGSSIVDAAIGVNRLLDIISYEPEAATASFIEKELEHLLEIDPDLVPKAVRDLIEHARDVAMSTRAEARKRLLS